MLCVNNFIRLTETVEQGEIRLPALGPRFVEPLTDTVGNDFLRILPAQSWGSLSG